MGDILGPMPEGSLNLFTDASVLGQFVGHFDGERWRNERSKVGPAMGAWIAWYGSDARRRPELAGQAFLGKQGTQRAEYLAAIYGLHAVLRYARLSRRPEQVILHLDNKTVAKTLAGIWVARAGGLLAYDQEAAELVVALQQLEIEFSWSR